MQPQKIALINDLSGFGRCSLGVAVPVLSALGHQCCMLPTAILSNHTGYESFTFTDFTPYMENYICEWKKRELSFSGIYTGFLGSERQVDMIRDFLDGFGQNALKVIDPVMGDHGKAYTTFSEDTLQKMSGLAKHADVLTPNVTELMILLGRPYPESI